MLRIKNLEVFINKKRIIKNANAEFKGINLLMGPNGSGKSSLALAIAGHPRYKTKGEIILNNIDISSLKPEERAKLGLFIAFQNPPEIEGLSLRKLASLISETYEKEAEYLNIKKLLDRSLNHKFSGGEKKRSELFQLMLIRPKFAILDEIDSGLDIEGIKKVKEIIENMKETSFLIITHHPEIAKIINASNIFIMVDGNIKHVGKKEVIDKIKEKGYDWL